MESLIAVAVELLSVVASEQRIKKPITVPRPPWASGKAQGNGGASEAVRRLASRMGPRGKGRVRVVGAGAGSGAGAGAAT